MELDKRIIKGKRPLTCFDIDEAENYVGKTCYISNNYDFFRNVDFTKQKILNGVEDCEAPFHFDSGNQAEFCLPCDWVTKETKYIPFANTKQFFLMRNFEVGDLIHLRSKKDNTEYLIMIIGRTDKELMLGNFQGLSFDELLQNYELWDCEDNKFIPFGIEVENENN